MNSFFACLQNERTPVPMDSLVSGATMNVHSDYFGGMLREAERRLQSDGWTFYVTWDLNELPEYGSRVVAIVMGDEWCRIPAYVDSIAATFKCYGTEPTPGPGRLSYQGVLEWMHFLQVRSVRLPGSVKRLLGSAAGLNREIHDIPIGYANQVDLPIKNFGERAIDVSFSGSILHRSYDWYSPKYWLKTPKSISRRRMFASIEEVSRSLPGLNIVLHTTPDYKSIRTSDPVEYSRLMMDTRISLVPRGTSLETYRFFEALRYGCVVLCERLPDRWFYRGCPAIQVDDWQDLQSIVPDLIDDPDALLSLHKRSLNWWRDKCSEESVGRFVADRLNRIEAR